MATKKDPYTTPQTWNKHMKKEGKKEYWGKVRAKAKIRISKLMKRTYGTK